MNEQKEIKYIDGMFFNEPPEKAKDFCKGKITFFLDKFIPSIESHQKDRKLKVDVLISKKTGKPYCKVDEYVSNNEQKTAMPYESVPTIQVEDEILPF